MTLIEKGRTLDDALDECRSFDALEGPDRAFARLIAVNALRRRGAIDHVIGRYVDRPPPARAARIMMILRIAAAQSLFLDTPAHAVVSTATHLAKSWRETEGYSGMVNAVARRIAEAGPKAIADLPERIDTPGWLWRSWERAYGPAVARKLAAAHQAEPPLDLTLKNPDDADDWAARLDATPVGAGSLRLMQRRDVTRAPGFDDGAWWVQDAAAAAPARILIELLKQSREEIAGARVFDLCAAPGGKTMQLAAAGLKTTAVDIAGMRLKRVADNLARTRLTAETVKADVLTWTPNAPADAVLLDAPCSATGTIRRHPDIPWSKTERDISDLADLQARMLRRAADMVRPGGTLIYCVCSLQHEEGERRVDAFLKESNVMARAPVDPSWLGDLGDAVRRQGDVRILPSMLPDRGGVDGFYIAALRRES